MRYFQAAICAGACALFFTVVLPLQTYLGNQDMFRFNLGEVAITLLLFFGGSFIVLFFILKISEECFGYFLHVILLSITIFYYLEVGVLSFGMPALNGNLDQFFKPTIRKYLDVSLFIFMLVMASIFYRKFCVCLKWIALGLILMSIASVFDANKPFIAKCDRSMFSDGFCSVYDVFKSTAYSTNRNIMVFVLDAAPADIATQIFKSDEALCEKFCGFVDFEQNIGVGEKTIRGVPVIATGRILEKEDDPHDFLYSFWGGDSFLREYLKKGYGMYVAPALFGFGYTNRRKSFSRVSCDDKEGGGHPFLRYTQEAPFLTFLDILKFRLSFYRGKLGVISAAMREGNRKMLTGQNFSGRENVFFEHMQKFPVLTGDDKSFLFYHLPGVHFPILFGRHGERLDKLVNDGLICQKGHEEEVCSVIRNYLHYIFEAIGAYLDWLRERNLYDQSMIVITSDHGIVNRPKSALLLVKLPHAKDAFRISDLPSSHEKVAEMMRMAAARDLSSVDLDAILSMDVRRLRIRQPSPEKWWQFGRQIDTYEIKFDKYGREMSRKNLGEFRVL